ncbi:hypothetical protein [Coralloluteibacterium stylophorae]|uniref:Uncharacterized protein n=2 Tax=Coralloluteibacterium stylophorae TaxID=1776034 RepID=A0AAP2FYL0_9GAMM|nr:hypothetical protein [Coralloluteibacterium stylophorae]MBS7455716.1 hypothetical protein [Coralloluteibacterium stylophorae]
MIGDAAVRRLAARVDVEPWIMRRLLDLSAWHMAAAGFEEFFNVDFFAELLEALGPRVPAMDDTAWHCLARVSALPAMLPQTAVPVMAIGRTARREGWQRVAELLDVPSDWRLDPRQRWPALSQVIDYLDLVEVLVAKELASIDVGMQGLCEEERIHRTVVALFRDTDLPSLIRRTEQHARAAPVLPDHGVTPEHMVPGSRRLGVRDAVLRACQLAQPAVAGRIRF